MEYLFQPFFVNEEDKKKRCWSCHSLAVIGWGKQQNKQRFRCKNCGLLFTNNDKLQTIENRFIWFKKWVVERQTYKTLQRDSGLSKDTLQRTFYHFLSKAPLTPIIRPLQDKLLYKQL